MAPEQKQDFVKAIGALKSTGGGDCPEMSITGIRNALSLSPKYGSPMFVFTDASAKDDTDFNMAAVKAMAKLHGTTISFFTRKQGCTSELTDGVKSYREIADTCAGKPLSSILSFSGSMCLKYLS